MKQKKWIQLILIAATMTLVLAGCGSGKGQTASDEAATDQVTSATEDFTVDLGESKLYSMEDREAAVELILKEFNTWEGCEMHSIRYDSDEFNNEKNLKAENDVHEGKKYTQCMRFFTNFHSPKKGGGAWEADKEYENYEWIFAREDGGKWELSNWGYE